MTGVEPIDVRLADERLLLLLLLGLPAARPLHIPPRLHNALRPRFALRLPFACGSSGQCGVFLRRHLQTPLGGAHLAAVGEAEATRLYGHELRANGGGCHLHEEFAAEGRLRRVHSRRAHVFC